MDNNCMTNNFGFELGVYLVTGVPDLGALCFHENGNLIGFTRVRGKVLRDNPFYYDLTRLPITARLSHINSSTLEEAANAFVEDRIPRWLLPVQAQE